MKENPATPCGIAVVAKEFRENVLLDTSLLKTAHKSGSPAQIRIGAFIVGKLPTRDLDRYAV